LSNKGSSASIIKNSPSRNPNLKIKAQDYSKAWPALTQQIAQNTKINARQYIKNLKASSNPRKFLDNSFQKVSNLYKNLLNNYNVIPYISPNTLSIPQESHYIIEKIDKSIDYKEDIEPLVDFYKNNLLNFYRNFQTLCYEKHNNVTETILGMEENINVEIQREVNQRLKKIFN